MQRLLNIIRFFKEYFVLGLLVIISLLLLSSNNNRQVRAIRSFTVGFVGAIQQALSVVPNVLELKNENAVLRQLNVNLSDEVSRLRDARLENLRLRTMLGLKERSPFHVLAADVVAKNLYLLRNTITLNVGEADGVKPDMPIISESGLVGKVITTSSHYAVGQLMFNRDFRASAKVLRSGVDGIIGWNGEDIVHLRNVGKKQDVQRGDIVVTSEYSNLFPRGIRIGVVSGTSEKPGSLLKDIEITPAANFTTLEQVFVVLVNPDPERVSLEQKTLSR